MAIAKNLIIFFRKSMMNGLDIKNTPGYDTTKCFTQSTHLFTVETDKELAVMRVPTLQMFVDMFLQISRRAKTDLRRKSEINDNSIVIP